MSTTNNLKVSESNVLNGLGAYTHTTLQNSMYFASVSSEVCEGTALVITIVQSGSASKTVTSPTPTTARRTVDIQGVFNCQAGDVLTVTLSSSAPIDNQLNCGVKTVVTVHPGSS